MPKNSDGKVVIDGDKSLDELAAYVNKHDFNFTYDMAIGVYK